MYELLIKNLSRHVKLTEDEINVIERLFKFRKFRRKQYIVQEGDITRHETFIVKGVTRTYEVDEKGQEHVLQFGLEDWWVGILNSFLGETPSPYNIDCIEDTEVLQINKDDLETLYREVPKMERHFRIMIQNAYMASVKRLSSNLAKSAAEQYEEFLAKYPHIEQRVPNHQIASYLGITPQSLSRIRSLPNSRKP